MRSTPETDTASCFFFMLFCHKLFRPIAHSISIPVCRVAAGACYGAFVSLAPEPLMAATLALHDQFA